MVYRDFKNAQSVARDFHLHLQIPAVGLFAHVEFLKRIATNGPKWGHIGVANTVKQPQNQSGQSSGNDLLHIHAAGFAMPARTGADHKIVRSARYRINKLIHESRYVAAIAIQKNHDLTFGRKRADTSSTGPSVSTRGRYDAGACFPRTIGCSISAAVINDYDLVRQTGRETLAHHAADWLLLIQRGNDDRDAAHHKLATQ